MTMERWRKSRTSTSTRISMKSLCLLTIFRLLTLPSWRPTAFAKFPSVVGSFVAITLMRPVWVVPRALVRRWRLPNPRR